MILENMVFLNSNSNDGKTANSEFHSSYDVQSIKHKVKAPMRALIAQFLVKTTLD